MKRMLISNLKVNQCNSPHGQKRETLIISIHTENEVNRIEDPIIIKLLRGKKNKNKEGSHSNLELTSQLVIKYLIISPSDVETIKLFTITVYSTLHGRS